jgi:hypothetical protein
VCTVGCTQHSLLWICGCNADSRGQSRVSRAGRPTHPFDTELLLGRGGYILRVDDAGLIDWH